MIRYLVSLAGLLPFILLGSFLIAPGSNAEAACDPATTCSGNGTCSASGACVCETGFTGASCNQCAPNFYGYPACKYCVASTTCSGRGNCNSSGNCVCPTGFTGQSCNQCATNYYNYPNCTYCVASTTCNGKGNCSPTGSCVCATGFTGAACNQCDTNYYNYPNCTYCVASTTCNGHGLCNSTGSCVCNAGYTGPGCNQCAAGYSGYPNCVLGSAPAPNITSISPGAAGSAGGTTLVLNGSNFGASGKITIGTQTCAVQTYSDAKIECSIPAGQGKDLPVTVDRNGIKSNIAKFSYDPPSIDALSPASGPAGGGTALAVSGKSFGLNPVVTIGGKPCAITARSHNRITCTTPSGTSGKSPVVVTAGGQSSIAATFSYTSP